jgi:purine nucleosidase
VRDIWLDTDPGFDDWMAWALLEGHPQMNLLGVSVVAGNAPLSQTLTNALSIRAFHGWRTPVHAGADRPLAQPVVTAQDVLGSKALATVGRVIPDTPARADSQQGVQALIDAVLARPGAVTLVAIGPLTNIANAFTMAPQLPGLLKELVVMGGSIDRGNTTAVAEFNIHADPEAAQIVLGHPDRPPIQLFGLHLCRQVLVGTEHVQHLRALGTERAEVFADHLQAYVDIAARRNASHMAVYDPTPIAWMLAPHLFEMQDARVDVELQGQLTRGMTVCEFRVPARAQANASVAMQADGPRVMALLMQELTRCLT